MQYVFFFFQPDYDLSIRLADLTIYDEITLQGYWSKKGARVFIATNFYLEEPEKEENNFSFEYGL